MTYDCNDTNELMEAVSTLEEALLLKHIWNRITALRQDRQLARNQMLRMIEKHPDPKERAEAKTHLAWLENEYVKMLSDRMKEIKQ